MKVKCTWSNGGNNFTVGKTYDVNSNGRMLINDGSQMFELEFIQKSGWYKFEPVVDRYELHITCNDGKTTNAVYKVNGKIEKRTEAVCVPSDTFNFATGAQTAFDRVFPKARPSQPIAPQEDKARFKVGQKVKVIGNCCCHGYSRGTILTLVRSVNFLRREPDWYVGEGTDYVSERDIEPYAEPEKEPEPVYYNGKVVCTEWKGTYFTAGKVYDVVGGYAKDNFGTRSGGEFKLCGGNIKYHSGKFIPYLGEA